MFETDCFDLPYLDLQIPSVSPFIERFKKDSWLYFGEKFEQDFIRHFRWEGLLCGFSEFFRLSLLPLSCAISAHILPITLLAPIARNLYAIGSCLDVKVVKSKFASALCADLFLDFFYNEC